ncbi:hypothetical protein [Pinibacter soli]|uniref:Secreted protein n=1 Tax=Pinibacter soli TaxID=3044211 RepID=A0ABT6RAN1_9BACT|nr:hypothetical protein [Pinibacter soli]MDI3319632.1 hypothetical protein [Pinibacter soli]
MKHLAVAVLLLLSFSSANAQISVSGNTITGMGKFHLGDSISRFTLDLKLPPNPLYEGQTVYQYQPSLRDSANSIKIADCYFSSVLLSFDSSNKLTGVCATKFYRKSANLTKEAKKDYKALSSYITNTLHKEGEDKIYHHGMPHTRKTWQKGNSSLRIETVRHEINTTYVEIELTAKDLFTE